MRHEHGVTHKDLAALAGQRVTSGVKSEHRSMAALNAVDAHTIPWAQDGYLCHLDLSKETSTTNEQQDDCTVS